MGVALLDFDQKGSENNFRCPDNIQVPASSLNRRLFALAIFSRHNLDMLALKKPGLITNRFNNGSEQVMESMENDTEELYKLTVPDTDN